MSHGVAEIKRLDLGNLNPFYERELIKPDVHQRRAKWNVSKSWAGMAAEDVGIRRRRVASRTSSLHVLINPRPQYL